MQTLRLVAFAATLALAGSAAVAGDALASSTSFNYTGAMATYQVPEHVHSLSVTAAGAAGGNGIYAGGRGATVSSTLAVTPGSTLYVSVGGNGVGGAHNAGGFNGGGSASQYNSGSSGGGASDIVQRPATSPAGSWSRAAAAAVAPATTGRRTAATAVRSTARPAAATTAGDTAAAVAPGRRRVRRLVERRWHGAGRHVRSGRESRSVLLPAVLRRRRRWRRLLRRRRRRQLLCRRRRLQLCRARGDRHHVRAELRAPAVTITTQPVTVDAVSYDFGATSLSGQSSHTFTVSNISDTPQQVSFVTDGASFSADGCDTGLFAAGATCSIIVTFKSAANSTLGARSRRAAHRRRWLAAPERVADRHRRRYDRSGGSGDHRRPAGHGDGHDRPVRVLRRGRSDVRVRPGRRRVRALHQPKTYTGLAVGEHAFEVRQTDGSQTSARAQPDVHQPDPHHPTAAGGRSRTPATWTWSSPSRAPSTTSGCRSGVASTPASSPPAP